MPDITEPLWQLDCLRDIAEDHPELVQAALSTLWHHYPGLRREVTLRAMAAKTISKREAAVCLGLAADEIARMARGAEGGIRTALVECESGRAALLPESRLPVWEVVRKLRELGSDEAALGFFSGLLPHELEAAKAYAATHTDEIDERIREYESFRAQRLAQSVN
ncbi:MAG: hypothetical protein JNJ45_00230 [Chthonomonas sp.]|nr:hypothetical protein [Chthonomonas sp.]